MSKPVFRPPRPESAEIPGDAGMLEAILDIPAQAGPAPNRFAVICHPHPLHGGSLTNKVVHTLARAFNECHIPTIRFNFRGVGASAGTFDNGNGETRDALAAIQYGKARWPGAAVCLGGFSFGGAVALKAAQSVLPERIVTVAPAIARLNVAHLPAPKCPWLVIQGDADDVVDPQTVLDWAAQQTPVPSVQVLNGAGHFFHGRLNELREIVLNFIATNATESPRPR